MSTSSGEWRQLMFSSLYSLQDVACNISTSATYFSKFPLQGRSYYDSTHCKGPRPRTMMTSFWAHQMLKHHSFRVSCVSSTSDIHMCYRVSLWHFFLNLLILMKFGIKVALTWMSLQSQGCQTIQTAFHGVPKESIRSVLHFSS